ncbi:hypothetical protein [Cohnella sp. GCM10027633]|uniref:hypothetical protein n=1 Tax=unclassified Cohnella TaxID=2636738 RepID=UPI00362AEC4D
MKLKYKYSEREFIQAMNQSSRDTRRWYVDFIIAILLLAYGIYTYMDGSNGFIVSFLIVISVSIIVAMFIRMVILPRVLFKREPKYKEEYELEFLEDEIRFTAGALKSSIPWSFYNDYKETKDLFI